MNLLRDTDGRRIPASTVSRHLNHFQGLADTHENTAQTSRHPQHRSERVDDAGAGQIEEEGESGEEAQAPECTICLDAMLPGQTVTQPPCQVCSESCLNVAQRKGRREGEREDSEGKREKTARRGEERREKRR